MSWLPVFCECPVPPGGLDFCPALVDDVDPEPAFWPEPDPDDFWLPVVVFWDLLGRWRFCSGFTSNLAIPSPFLRNDFFGFADDCLFAASCVNCKWQSYRKIRGLQKGSKIVFSPQYLSYYWIKSNVEGIQKNRLSEIILSTHNIGCVCQLRILEHDKCLLSRALKM